MALHRLLYRRKNCLMLCLMATTFWVLYLIISAPAASDIKVPLEGRSRAGDQTSQLKLESVTRKHTADVKDSQPASNNVVIEAPEGTKLTDPNVNVIPRPPDPKDASETVKAADPSQAKTSNKSVQESLGKSDFHDGTKQKPAGGGNNTEVAAKPATNETNPPMMKELGFDKVMEMGVKFKNKTIEVGERMRNKTLEKLVDFGVIKRKEFVKLIYERVGWQPNLTMADIGRIMQDTDFLKKKQNLTEMDYHPLLPTLLPGSNTTNITRLNSTTQGQYGVGYCKCRELSCLCCVRVFNKWMHLNSTACCEIDFSSKSQELEFRFSFDHKPIYKNIISAQFPPKICMESTAGSVGVCILFSDVVSRVDMEAESHKIQLAGCLELDLTLYNKTVSAFPVSCFKIPGEEAEKDKDAIVVGNFMP